MKDQLFNRFCDICISNPTTMHPNDAELKDMNLVTIINGNVSCDNKYKDKLIELGKKEFKKYLESLQNDSV